MALIRPQPGRAKIQDEGELRPIEVPLKGPGWWWVVTGFIVWMCLGSVGWETLVKSLVRNGIGDLVVILGPFGMALWYGIGILVIYVLWSESCGCLTVTADVLVHFRPLLRRRDYQMAEVRNLRVEPSRQPTRAGRGPFRAWPDPTTIAFDYGGRTVRFRTLLGEFNAKWIVDLIRSRFGRFMGQ